ncbi:hypothetical protein FTUN_3592 [Frigoriglobus tundricola]|uniref:Uncharacterized protein n=1 Tax=Frigoriglobus tundricola TaxID=2774151 RepID=A0A6M5YQ38_9BACT|nr:hypothetical protein FTUN_3592 [Frigoriglobus tundricola]
MPGCRAVFSAPGITFRDFYPRSAVARHPCAHSPARASRIRLHTTKSLFPCDELEVSPTPGLIKDTLRAIPDGKLRATLNARRHNRCNTYPVSVLWGVLLLSIILRHTSIEACLEELRRSAPLRVLIGIENEGDVPNGWNRTRFLAVLGQPPPRTTPRHLRSHGPTSRVRGARSGTTHGRRFDRTARTPRARRGAPGDRDHRRIAPGERGAQGVQGRRQGDEGGRVVRVHGASVGRCHPRGGPVVSHHGH